MSNPLSLPMVPRALRNLFSAPVTRRYPAQVRPAFVGARGSIEVDFDSCVLCGLCVRRCPTAAITCSREEGWLVIDHLACVACGACVDACNKNGLRMTTTPQSVFLPSQTALGPERPGHEEWRKAQPALAVAEKA